MGEQGLRNQGFEELTAFPADSTAARLFSKTSMESREEQAGSQQGLLPPVLNFTFLSSCSLTCPPGQSHRLQSEAACLFNHYFSDLLKGPLDTGTAQSKKVQSTFGIQHPAHPAVSQTLNYPSTPAKNLFSR